MTPRASIPVAALLAGLLASCATVRGAWLELRNEDRTGEVAPALVNPTWLHAQEEDFEGATLQRTWRLFVFFLPT